MFNVPETLTASTWQGPFARAVPTCIQHVHNEASQSQLSTSTGVSVVCWTNEEVGSCVYCRPPRNHKVGVVTTFRCTEEVVARM